MSGSAISRTMCIYVYAYMYAICTRYVCGSAGTSRQRGTSTHYMHAAARPFHALCACGSAALSRTICMRQRGHFHSFTLKAARRHLGMSAATVCLTARAFEFVGVCSSLLEFAFEFVGVCVESGVSLGRPVSAVLRSCGPVVLRVWFVLSCCQRCMRTT